MARSIAFTGTGPRLPANGGSTQTNALGGGTCFPFMNLFKTALGWRYDSLPTDTSLPTMPVIELDSNGYAKYLPAGVTGIFSFFYFPPSYANEGTYVLEWDGIGVLSLVGGFDEAAGETQTLASIESLTDAGGRFEFDRTDDNTTVSLRITETGTGPTNGDYVRNIRIYAKVDEDAYNGGQILSSKFLEDTLYARPGALRTLGWIGEASNGTNVCNVGLWAHNKPNTHMTWCGDEFRASYYAGIATVSGNDYTVAMPGFTLSDKCIVHVLIGEQSANDAKTGELVWSADIASGTPGVITWVAHGLAANNEVWLQDTAGSGALPSPLADGTPYYVKTVLGVDTFTISSTRGGAAINISGSGTGYNVVSPWTMNVEGSGAIPMVGNFRFTPEQCFLGYARLADLDTANSTIKLAGMVMTLAYDETTNYWDRYGGENLGYAGGITAGVPPEIILLACQEIGCQPHFAAPYHAMETTDPHTVTDWTTELAELCKSYQDSSMPWLCPIFEPPNETWNTQIAFRQTYFAQAVSWARWGVSDVDYANHAYGKWASTMGQAVSAVFADDRTKYMMTCAYQTVGFNGANPGDEGSYYPGFDKRLESTKYVTEDSGDPASDWVTHGNIANYFTPAAYFYKEFFDYAWTAYVTNLGNSAAQLAQAELFAATALMAQAEDDYNAQYNLRTATNAKAYFASRGMVGMLGYEGGWSPDYLPSDPIVYVTGATKASSCVLTCYENIHNNYTGYFSGGLSGVKVGMCLTPSFAAGMTELNNDLASGACTFPASGTTITSTNTFSVDDAVAFYGHPPAYLYLPPELSPGKAYYVKTIEGGGTGFTIAATKGGAAITMTSPGSTAVPVVAYRGWRVTAVDAGANTITLDVDSTGFTTFTYTPDGNGIDSTRYALLRAGRALLNTLSYDAKATDNVALANTESYENWYGLTDDDFEVLFFSNFLYYGLSNAWTIKDPDPWVANTPHWESIHEWNSNDA
jgi:hypothetical protein